MYNEGIVVQVLEMQSTLETTMATLAVQSEMEWVMKSLAVCMVVVVVALVIFAMKMLKVQSEALRVMKQMKTSLENLQWSSEGSLEKLAFLESRVERLVQHGSETARHLVQIVHEYNMEVAGGSLKWALRQTVEVYQSWRAARIMQKGSCSKIYWNLVVESAKEWVKDEVEGLLQEAATSREGGRVQQNLQFFELHMPQWWCGAAVEDVMKEYAMLENMQLVREGVIDTTDEAHEWSNGVSFRSKHLLEPNKTLNR